MRGTYCVTLWGGVFAALVAGCASERMIVAYRGAAGYVPEHTFASKVLAFAQGADYLQQDVVLSKDNQLIVAQSHILDNMTDVAEKFPRRQRADGHFYVIDFTVEELSLLRATNSFYTRGKRHTPVYGQRFPLWKPGFRLHTFEEELQFIRGLEQTTGKKIGIYSEIKVPWFHHQEGKDIAALTLALLKKYVYQSRSDLVYVQTYDFNELKRIKRELLPKYEMNVKLIQRVAYTDQRETQEKDSRGKWINYNYNWMFEPGGMQKIAKYADGVGPDWRMLIENEWSKVGAVRLSPMVSAIQDAKLECHVHTVRKETLPSYARTMDEMFSILFKQTGANVVLTDFPDLGVKFLGKPARY